jgi:hypothetical protein
MVVDKIKYKKGKLHASYNSLESVWNHHNF